MVRLCVKLANSTMFAEDLPNKRPTFPNMEILIKTTDTGRSFVGIRSHDLLYLSVILGLVRQLSKIYQTQW